MFNRILVPVDLTKKSLVGVEVAHAFASQSRAEVTLLHVIETIEHIPFDEMKPFYKRLEKSARKGLREFSEKFLADKLKIDLELIYGHRSQEIVKYATAHGIDLIIMSSHRIDPNRSGHDWSSISYTVAILAPCPVLLVK